MNPRTHIPVEKGTREKLYDVKRGLTWDALFDKLLQAYAAHERAVRSDAKRRQTRFEATRRRGKKQSEKREELSRGTKRKA